MVRQLYIILLALHPARFRHRFGFEMLAIFDEAATHGSTLPLLADGFLSLVRQWLHPYRPVEAAAAPAGSGIPAFHSLDTSLPRRRHLMTGAALTLALFSALTMSIGHGGRSSGILIGAFLSRQSVLGVDRNSIQPSRPTTEVRVRPAPPERAGARLGTNVYALFSFGVLDGDGDQRLSAAEMANAPAMLRSLDRNKDGSLEWVEMYPLLVVLDRDWNGVISSDEISGSTAGLQRLDANHDGRLAMEEVVAGLRAAKGH
jgi:hypothetical protein